MKFVFSHQTAFLIYRTLRSNTDFSISKVLEPVNKFILPDLCNSKINKAAVEECSSLVKTQKPILLISNKKMVNKYKNVSVCSCKLNLPNNSFRKIIKNTYIPSPELLFYQLSQRLNFEKLFLAGLELCGCFSLSIEDNKYIKNVSPVTSSKKISEYLNKLQAINKNAQSIRKAIYCANLLSDDAYSPQEARLYIMLCSPHKFGGYGIKNLKFNQRIKLTTNAGKMCFQEYIYPDLSNDRTKLAIEYDSEEFHNNDYQYKKDKLRINALQNQGWMIFTFVKECTHNIETFDSMAISILKQNGQETRIKTKNFAEKRDKLFKSLYFSNI